MKLLKEIVEDNIAKTAALMNDPHAMMQEARIMEGRMMERLRADPAMGLFVNKYAQPFLSTYAITPEMMRPSLVQSILTQVLIEWEDVNIVFENQIKPSREV
jgi:hypothetical protein